jgi:enediyne biosynthesis thioesterase
MPKTFEYRHVVSFDETNVVGNVYYVTHLRWQGRCREMFLRAHAPGILKELEQGLALVTVRCSCDYFDEVFAFDEILVQMRLEAVQQNRVRMGFDYLRTKDGASTLIARGTQEVAAMRKTDRGLVAAPLPDELRSALELYSG